MTDKHDLYIAVYHTSRGEWSGVESYNSNISYLIEYDYVRLVFEGDKIFFTQGDKKTGLRYNNRMIQIQKQSVLSLISCFEGSYDLNYSPQRKCYYIDYNTRSDRTKRNSFGMCVSGNKTVHDKINRVAKDYDVNVEDCTIENHKKTEEKTVSLTPKGYKMYVKNSTNISTANSSVSVTILDTMSAMLEEKDFDIDTFKAMIKTVKTLISR